MHSICSPASLFSRIPSPHPSRLARHPLLGLGAYKPQASFKSTKPSPPDSHIPLYKPRTIQSQPDRAVDPTPQPTTSTTTHDTKPQQAAAPKKKEIKPTPYLSKARDYDASMISAHQTSVSFFSKWISPTLVQKFGKAIGLENKAQTFQRDVLRIYDRCVTGTNLHADWVVHDAKLPDTFHTWFSVNIVHVWMVMVRLRAEGRHGTDAIQGVVNNFFRETEDRLWAMGLNRSAIVDRSIKELLTIFYGAVNSYDTALTHSDIALASNLWRNLFQSAPHVQVTHLADYVHFIRKELAALESIPKEKFLVGDWEFAHVTAHNNRSKSSSDKDTNRPLARASAPS